MTQWKKLAILRSGSYATIYLASIILPQEWNAKIVAMKSSSSFSILSLEKEKRILKLLMGCKESFQYYFDEFSIERNYVYYNLFLEFAPYGSLGDLLKKGSLLDKEVRIYTHMLIKGLSCIHQNGVVHCDLKPNNILLFPSSEKGVRYQLKIADFGLSKTREETNVDFGKIYFRGTPLYMSPESVVGMIETPLDIWSLGCIVIEMITGFYAWRNLQTQKELLIKLACFQKVPTIPNELSWDCKNFLSKCFMTNPRQRWTATMLLNHPFIHSIYNRHSGYQNAPTFSSSFFSYDIFNYVSLEV